MIWKPSVTVAAVIERGGRFLFVEERIDGRLVLNQPAGHLDPGESLLAACRREVLEETAHDFEPQSLEEFANTTHPTGGANTRTAARVRASRRWRYFERTG